MTQATLIRKSTGEVLQRGVLPVADPLNDTVPGLDPDLEWLIDYEPFAAPLYDARVYQLVTVLDATADPHPDYPLYNQYKITYATQRRDVDEIKSHIINKEREELTRHVDYLPKLAILACGILFRELDGLTLTPREAAIRQRTINAAVKVYQNDVRRRQLENEAAQAQPLDIDAGWADADDNEPV